MLPDLRNIFEPPATTPEQAAARSAAALSRAQSAPGFSPTIRSYGDLNYWLTDEQKDVWRRWLRYDSPNSAGMHGDLRNEPDVLESMIPWGWAAGKRLTWDYFHRALEEGRANINRAAVLRVVARVWENYYAHKSPGWVQRHLLVALDVSTANLEFAGYKVARAMQDDKQGVIAAADAWGIKTDLSDSDLGGALAYAIADAATSQALTIPQVVDLYPPVAGSGSMLSEFWNDAKDWFNAAVIKNIGRVFVAVAEAILSARKNVPWLGTFFLDPLGISLLAEGMRQFGEYMRTGDAAASFNERVLVYELGVHWTALGQALIVAGGIIAQSGIGLPFGVLIAAIGAVLYAAGNVIVSHARAKQAASAARAADEQYKAGRDELADNCAAALAADFGLDPSTAPRNPDKCVQLYGELSEAADGKTTHAATARRLPGWALPAAGAALLLLVLGGGR